MLRWLFRLGAVALMAFGLWLLSQPTPASTAETSNEIRGWVLVVLGAIYFIADYRLKLRADRRAERDEARKEQTPSQKADDGR